MTNLSRLSMSITTAFSRRVRQAALVMVALTAFSGVAFSDEGISVTGIGDATAKPTKVEISATLSADAELAADATVKFRDARKRAMAAVDALKNPNVSVSSDGVGINSPMDANAQMMMNRGMTVPASSKVQIMENCRLIMDHADQMDSTALMNTVLKLIDVGRDAGFSIGPPPPNPYEGRSSSSSPLAVFKYGDVSGLRDDATKAAIEDAKAKAQKIADLSGVKLGRIVAVSQGAATEDTRAQILRDIYGSGQKKPDSDKEVVSNTSGDLKMRVTLKVQFEILK